MESFNYVLEPGPAFHLQVGGVMMLLESRGLAAPFRSTAQILAKRQDGSTIRTAVDSAETMADLEARIASIEVGGNEGRWMCETVLYFTVGPANVWTAWLYVRWFVRCVLLAWTFHSSDCLETFKSFVGCT